MASASASIPIPKLSRTAARAGVAARAIVPCLPAHAARKPWVPAPATPFFADEAHRRPTRGLYRALLRALGGVRGPGGWAAALAQTAPAPSPPPPSLSPTPTSTIYSSPTSTPTPTPYPHTLAALRAAWRHRRAWVSAQKTRAFLETQYALLSDLRGGAAAPALQQAEDTHRARAERRASLAAAAAAAAANTHPAHPHLTGSMVARSPFYGPMPRLRPQPLRFTMMVKARRVRRERLFDKRQKLREANDDMRAELGFWRALGLGDAGGWDSGVGMAAWHAEGNRAIEAIDDEYKLQARRAALEPSPWLVRRVRLARRKRTQVLQARAVARRAALESETEEERRGVPGRPRGSHRRGKSRVRTPAPGVAV